MKQYSCSEVFKVTIASGIAYERLDLGVVSFTNGIAYWIQGVVEQAIQMLLQHVRDLGQWFKFKASHPTPPVIEKGSSLAGTAELPELGEGLFGRPGFGYFQIKFFDHIKHLFVIIIPVLRSTKEQVFSSLKPVLALIGQFLALGSSYLVNSFVEVLGNVKTIMHDTGLGSVQHSCFHISRPHVHCRCINLMSRIAQRFKQGVGSLAIAVFYHLDHTGLLQVSHKRRITMSPPEGFLVDPHFENRLLLTPGQPTFHRPVEDALELIITEPQQVRSLLMRAAALKRFDDQKSEKGSKVQKAKKGQSNYS